MRRVRSCCLAFVLAAAALAADDPWDVPAPSGLAILSKLQWSSRAETSAFAMPAKPSEGANGREAVLLSLSDEEIRSVLHVRRLVADGDIDGALASADAAIARSPANWDAFAARAVALHAKKADAEALLALRASLIGNRRNPDAWKLLEDVAGAVG